MDLGFCRIQPRREAGCNGGLGCHRTDMGCDDRRPPDQPCPGSTDMRPLSIRSRSARTAHASPRLRMTNSAHLGCGTAAKCSAASGKIGQFRSAAFSRGRDPYRHGFLGRDSADLGRGKRTKSWACCAVIRRRSCRPRSARMERGSSRPRSTARPGFGAYFRRRRLSLTMPGASCRARFQPSSGSSTIWRTPWSDGDAQCLRVSSWVPLEFCPRKYRPAPRFLGVPAEPCSCRRAARRWPCCSGAPCRS